jgi:DNA helicase-2/ATP-dependent DNA helicase PcrA
MPSANRVIICAAGGGKTTRIVGEAGSLSADTLLVTYTRNNEGEIRRKFYEAAPVIPSHIEVMTWFGFLLRELARPYRRAMHPDRIENIKFIEGRSVPYIPASKPVAHYFHEGRYIYSDKIAKFICECNKLTGGAVLRRLSMRFKHIYIDEVQDLAGYDLDIIEMILAAGIKLTLVGDYRQSTFKTNQSKKNMAFSGTKIIGKFREWEKRDLLTLGFEQHTHRCHQHIADLGDSLFPNEPTTKSLNTVVTGHDGVFTVSRNHLTAYLATYQPQILRFDRRTDCGELSAMNFGESKGRTFDRVLIFPHGLAKKWLSTGNVHHLEKSAARMYVGITRAKHSLAFVFDGPPSIMNAQVFSPHTE